MSGAVELFYKDSSPPCCVLYPRSQTEANSHLMPVTPPKAGVQKPLDTGLRGMTDKYAVYFLNNLLLIPTSPASPEPSSHTAAGIGTGAVPDRA